jgi:tRNA threonylcarbamoyladenosine biosynthesis protein TsaE
VRLQFTLKEIKEAATQFWQVIAGYKVVAFHGKMGAGKTTFIHALCDVKGITDAVGSPTFSIINEYIYEERGEKKKLYHIDLYRLKDEQEAIRAGVEDCLYSNHICFVEWPERIPRLFPADTIHVFIEPVDENTRVVRIGDN